MLSLAQLKDAVMLNSGQYMTEFDDTLMDNKQFVSIVTKQLEVYNRYYPLVKKFVFNLYNNKVFTVEKDGVIPDSICEIRDVRATNYYNMLVNGSTTQYGIISNLNWKYYSPELYFQYVPGQYECKCLIYHKFDPVRKVIDTMEPEFIGTHNYFLNLVTGKFMEFLGKSRQAFTISGLPVDTNASDLVSDGKELYQSTMDTIKINSRFDLAVLV